MGIANIGKKWQKLREKVESIWGASQPFSSFKPDVDEQKNDDKNVTLLYAVIKQRLLRSI